MTALSLLQGMPGFIADMVIEMRRLRQTIPDIMKRYTAAMRTNVDVQFQGFENSVLTKLAVFRILRDRQ